MKGSIDSIETFGLVDGPGIRTVVFMSGCKLRCKYCQNPETWCMCKPNYSVEDLVNKIIRNKPYFKNGGGVTFSGGEPLLQSEFIIEVCKILKRENIHIALDTAGVGNGDYKQILSYVDLVLFDIKFTNKEGYKDLTGHDIDDSLEFIKQLNESNKKVWIRQVIVPGLMDNMEYIKCLVAEVKKINNVEKIEFLPYHTMGKEKYHKIGIKYPYENIESMDKVKCDELYQQFINLYGND